MFGEKPTPVMSEHARQRCVEMGISTKVAKRIVQNPVLTYPTPQHGDDRVIIRSNHHPEYAVAYDQGSNTVCTVIFNCYDFYARDGVTFIREPRTNA